jgi:hypothetical protein
MLKGFRGKRNVFQRSLKYNRSITPVIGELLKILINNSFPDARISHG